MNLTRLSSTSYRCSNGLISGKCGGQVNSLNHFCHQSHLHAMLRGPFLMLTCPLLALSAVNRGQHGHLYWSAATQPCTQQTDTRTRSNIFSNLSCSSSSVGLDHTAHSLCSPRATISLDLTLVHQFSFLGQNRNTSQELQLWRPRCLAVTIWPLSKSNPDTCSLFLLQTHRLAA